MRELAPALLALLVSACNPSKGGAIASEGASAATVPSRPAVTTATAGAASTGQVGDSAARVRVVPVASDADALSTIRTRRLEAKAEGRVLVVYVGATWCEPCKSFKRELESGRLDARLSRVTLLAFDADKDGDRLRAADYTIKAVPFVALPAPDGRPLELAQAAGKSPDAWRVLLDQLDAWQRP